jgi:hypothetical protein
MAGKGNKIITGLLLLAAIGTIVGYYLWNKPHENIASAKGIKIPAPALLQVFIADSTGANKKYYQQVLEVTGMVKSISKNLQNQTVVILKTNTEGSYINCTMEGGAENIKEGSSVIIKGVCQGIQGDADLGIMGDVYLIRCYIPE